jgi:hypothetical protein
MPNCCWECSREAPPAPTAECMCSCCCTCRHCHERVVLEGCLQVQRRLPAMQPDLLATATWGLAAAAAGTDQPQLREELQRAVAAVAQHVGVQGAAYLQPSSADPGAAAAPAAASSQSGARAPAAAPGGPAQGLGHRGAVQLAWALAATGVRHEQALGALANAAEAHIRQQLAVSQARSAPDTGWVPGPPSRACPSPDAAAGGRGTKDSAVALCLCGLLVGAPCEGGTCACPATPTWLLCVGSGPHASRAAVPCPACPASTLPQARARCSRAPRTATAPSRAGRTGRSRALHTASAAGT